MKTTTNEKAIGRFIQINGEIDEKVRAIRHALENHFEFDCDEINWGHVGTAGEINSQLGQVLEIIRNATHK